MIADVAFDAPIVHPFSYLVPGGWTLSPGQRVVAPLKGAARVGMVVAVRDGDDGKLKPLLRVADPEPVLSPERLDLVRWIAAESLSSVGSTCAALLPPPAPGGDDSSGERGGNAPAPGRPAGASHGRPQLLIGGGRERRLLERIGGTDGPVLVLTADVEAAARWAQRLEKIDRVVRLDSGVPDGERAAGSRRFAAGAVRLATGTRSALLTPVAAGGALVLVDEHEAAHKPPGPPRMHSREIVLERAGREGRAAFLTSATPSVEMWWRCDARRAELVTAPPTPWPAVTLADTRGILRREPLTPTLARTLRETLAARQRAFLLVSRLTSSLACDECGEVLRCADCAIALAYSRAAARLACRLCGQVVVLPDTCPACHGRRLSLFGWGAERVEHAVRRRFPDVRIARYDPDAVRGPRGEAQRAAAAAADVVIGTRGALRLFGPGSLGLAGLVTPDQFLRVPDFRAGERALGLMWAAAERVRPDGAVIVQSQNPAHYAFDALARQDLRVFYARELPLRAELGYPPFRRLAVLTVRGESPADTRRRADELVAALRGGPLTVYPPSADRRERLRRIVVKGQANLPRALAPVVTEFRRARPQRRGIIDVEMDPVEWQS